MSLFSPVYRAQFDKTIIEDKVQEPYMKKMIGLISILLAISVGLFSFLRKYGMCTGFQTANFQSVRLIQCLHVVNNNIH